MSLNLVCTSWYCVLFSSQLLIIDCFCMSLNYYTYHIQYSNFYWPLFDELSTNMLILLSSKYLPCELWHAVNLLNNTCLILLCSCFLPNNVLPALLIPHTIHKPSDTWSLANCLYPISSPCYKTYIVLRLPLPLWGWPHFCTAILPEIEARPCTCNTAYNGLLNKCHSACHC